MIDGTSKIHPLENLVDRVMDKIGDKDFCLAYATVVVPKILRGGLLYQNHERILARWNQFFKEPTALSELVNTIDEAEDPQAKYSIGFKSTFLAIDAVVDLPLPFQKTVRYKENDPTVSFINKVVDRLEPDARFIVGFVATRVVFAEAANGHLDPETAIMTAISITSKVEHDAKFVFCHTNIGTIKRLEKNGKLPQGSAENFAKQVIDQIKDPDEKAALILRLA